MLFYLKFTPMDFWGKNYLLYLGVKDSSLL